MRIILLFLILIANLGYPPAAGKSQPLSRIGKAIPIGSHPRPRASGMPLRTLGEGLCSYLSFDQHLCSFSADGLETEALFTRNSPAYLPDMLRKETHVARFLTGRFGQGILIEHGSRNRLPGLIAGAEFAPEGFAPIRNASLSRIKGIQGDYALKVDVTQEEGGFQTKPTIVPLSRYHSFSMYAKGQKGQTMELVALAEGKDEPLGRKHVTLTGVWQRVWLDYVATEKRDPPYEFQLEKSPPLTYRVTLSQPGIIVVDALMVETHIGYGGRRSLSSWVAGERTRDGEVLSLPPPDNPHTGSVAFWFSPLGALSWRTLLCIDNGNGWTPDLRLDLRDNRRMELVLPGSLIARKDLDAVIPDGEWHHVALTWDGAKVAVFWDGAQLMKVDDAPQRDQLGNISIGGVSTGPGVRADSVIDEFAQWSKPLTEDAISTLAASNAPLSDGMDVSVTLTQREPIRTYARDDMRRSWRLRLNNRRATPIPNATVTYGVEGLWEKRAYLIPISAGSACDFAVPWEPAFLEPGRYTMNFRVVGKDVDRRYRCPIDIVAARAPAENVSVITWGGFGEDLASLGITSAGLTGSANGPANREVETATRNRLYSQLRQFLWGDSESDADCFIDVAGNRGQVDQRSPGALADLQAKMSRLADRVALFPDIRQMIINSEHQWLWAHDMRPASMEIVKNRFALDLKRWIALKPKDSGQVTHPLGRLSAKAVGYNPPGNGILLRNEPFYAYHRWWLSDGVGNEIFVNDCIARAVKAKAPWVQCIAEPVLRRPAVRAFRNQDIVEEWFYYPHPPTAVWVQEAATAAARGTRARIAGMPQFLFKPGMAAPYGGMPAPHMYREVVWHCIARPLRALTYWNLWGAISRSQDKSVMTQDEIDEKLGPTPDWNTATSKISVKGEASSIFLFIPELREEIGRMHNEVVHPLGALLVRWQNEPRRLAVYRSFAAQLFNEVRWPGNDPLARVVERTRVPFDILYDEDFEDNPHLLEGYHVVVLQECAAVTEDAARQLRAFLARGGKVIADDYFTVPIEGVTRFLWRGVKDDAVETLQKKEQELLKLYDRSDHPLFIEGMQEAAREFVESEGPSGKCQKEMTSSLALSVTTQTSYVFHNLLRAEGARYIVAVNDLRMPGKYYGHFGRVREVGVAQAAEFEVDSALGNVAYQLLTANKVTLTRTENRLRLRLELPPAGGCIVIFLPEEIQSIRLSPVSASNATRGKTLQLQGQLLSKSGALVPGIIPVEVTITKPDGSRHDYSRYAAFVKGQWSLALPIPFNATTGKYRLDIRELAGGACGTLEWQV